MLVFPLGLVCRDGGFYSNKPPGAGFRLLPAAFLVDLLTPGPVDLTILVYGARVLPLTLPFVLFLLLRGRTLGRLPRNASEVETFPVSS